MPPKKKLAKRKPTTTAERVGNSLTPQYPSKGGVCMHTYGACFKVRLTVVESGKPDTFHMPDEGTAVLFAMRHSRKIGGATVYGPDGNVVCEFSPRTYDVEAWVHKFTQYNEDHHFKGDKYDQRNKAAAAARSKQQAASSAPAKKKVLKKR